MTRTDTFAIHAYDYHPEQPESPPSPDEATYNRLVRLGDLEIEIRVIETAQDEWNDLNQSLHALGPLPPEILEGWDRVKPWLNTLAAAAVKERDALEEDIYCQTKKFLI